MIDGRAGSSGGSSVSLGLSKGMVTGRRGERPAGVSRGAERAHHGNQSVALQRAAGAARLGRAAMERGAIAWATCRGAERMSARSRLSDRFHAVHWMQGLRGRLQGMERHRRRRVQLARLLLRQHGRARTFDLAAREVRGRRDRAGTGRKCAGRTVLGIFFRRLQALRSCRVPGGLPNWRHRAHGVRRRLYPAGRL